MGNDASTVFDLIDKNDRNGLEEYFKEHRDKDHEKEELRDELGRTPLLRASANGFTSLCNMLIDIGFDKEAVNKEGN